ncbi:MAG: hybrid sensor histidine kinase/response regulator [Desulfuromonadales bacterium GWD2_61_12]|nr:MAG: hybrid sensor histidine kinase/response regulator [Desulfuromonadales bacterium GWC2_61_20]OGR34112.1 MAG: hybrid sensor histidine kinase/response regulator [Desulfuromonadales bacterium GWD2_61_12]HAD04782.1 hybrid sensor histidine kinase/response regulator [Desulfuromonas sp.]HBT82302.1 hybrid sensor histidine kinase/response regulator [Desulfuromonas sp.]
MSNERILVVDDEKVILELTTIILQRRGYEVYTAANGEDGLAQVERHRPDLILLDYMMPHMDGMTALRRIRQNWPETSVIMFTGKGSEEIAVEIMKAGAADYLLKPFNGQILVERIETVLRLRRIELDNLELQREKERLTREVAEWNLELSRRVEQKSSELERAHTEIVQSEKLAALGHLSAGLAHEIRNPLNAIGLFAQLLRSGLRDDPEKCSYLDKVEAEVERIDRLLIRLLAVSKRSRVEHHPVQIRDAIENALLHFYPQMAAQGVSFNKDFPEQTPPILADLVELEQVFTNLVANALSEMKKGGTLAIHLRKSGEYLEVLLQDTGPGVPKEDLGRIFDPFFTTREKGTGFGLSVVLRIVKSCGGRISVESEAGQGATFRIEFPIAPQC